MPITLETLDANDTLPKLQNAIQQYEASGFELITLARGVVDEKPSNTATFRMGTPGVSPGPLQLVEVDGSLSLPQQMAAVNAGEDGGRRLISYAAVFVQAQETNVAAYRG